MNSYCPRCQAYVAAGHACGRTETTVRASGPVEFLQTECDACAELRPCVPCPVCGAWLCAEACLQRHSSKECTPV